jgi:replication-associated recombination protein RarA
MDWKNTKTKNDYNADEVISALQKDIRRGNQESAGFWAYELHISGDDFRKKLWERLRTIAVEDISFGNPDAIVMIRSLYESYLEEYENDDDKLIHAIYAATYLASCTKDRYVDELKNYFKKYSKLKEIPDYALDKHTKRGKEMGRDSRHFWEEGSIIKPELEYRNRKYLETILKNLD